MTSENRNLKIAMIVVNVLIWGYALYEVIPVLLGRDEGDQPTEVRRDAAAGDQAGRDAGARTNAVRRGDEAARGDAARRGDGRDAGRAARGAWKAADPVAFFADARDPFLPFVVPVDEDARSVARRDRRVDYQLPQGDQVEKKQVQTIYRLTSVFVVNGTKVMAILSSGQGNESVTAVQGQQLPDGDVVREINQAGQYLLVEKEGYLFKLVAQAPYVILVKKP